MPSKAMRFNSRLSLCLNSDISCLLIFLFLKTFGFWIHFWFFRPLFNHSLFLDGFSGEVWETQVLWTVILGGEVTSEQLVVSLGGCNHGSVEGGLNSTAVMELEIHDTCLRIMGKWVDGCSLKMVCNPPVNTERKKHSSAHFCFYFQFTYLFLTWLTTS